MPIYRSEASAASEAKGLGSQQLTAIERTICPCCGEAGEWTTRNGTDRIFLRTLHDYETLFRKRLQYHRNEGIYFLNAYAS